LMGTAEAESETVAEGHTDAPPYLRTSAVEI